MWPNIVIIFILIIISGLTIYYLTKNNNNKNAIYNFILTALTGAVLLLTYVLVCQTNYIQELTSNDIPNYPTEKYKIEPIKTYSYIDTRYGNNIIYEVDYTVKYSKLNPPESYNFSIDLPTKIEGLINLEESRGLNLEKYIDAPNDTVKIINVNKTNPLLLHIVYVSEEQFHPNHLIYEEPLPDIKNNSIATNSFYIKIRNIGEYDIKTLKIQSNVTRWVDVSLIQLNNLSWTNQPIIIFDCGLPVTQTIINSSGVVTWEINSIKSGEQKVYYFKQIEEFTHKI